MENLENKNYIFLIDADGTLVQEGTKVIKENIINKIKDLKKKGHIFVMATGRVLNDVVTITGAEVFDYYAVLMGNYIYNAKTLDVVQKLEYLSKDVVEKLVKYLDDNDIYWSYKTAVSQKSYHQAKGIAEKYLAEDCSKEDYIRDLNNGKIQQILTDGYIEKKVQDKFSNLNFFEMPQNYTDISHKNSSKENVVKYFRQNYKDYTIVSIGDSQNDLPMLKVADISIVMGNALEDVKRYANFVTTDIDEDGLINAFDMLDSAK